VDIQEFYDGDPRRRAGEERSFGMEWSSTADPQHRWDLFWNAGTGELYLMAKPVHSNWVGWNVEDAKDDLRALEALEHRIVGELDHLLHPRQVYAKTGTHPGERYKEALTEELTVEILAVIPDSDEVVTLLDGWQEEAAKPDSLTWLRARIASRATG
jgi:hypothetical protein